MTFLPTTLSVDLSGCTHPDARSHLIGGALDKATRHIGQRPTHVLVDRSLQLNIEILDEYGLRVHRQSVAWVWQLCARLAVAVPEPEPRMVRGAPRRLQATLL